MPGKDWVLSHFGREEDAVPESQAPASSVVWLFGKWVEQGPVDESAPPQSGNRPSLNAPAEASPKIPLKS
ncbi:MAG TPA: hypothetical protein VJV79_02795 [Polyangiaceae bacterium]|nr:hypothetical protein [Polyangiaceae bacterium]